MSEKGTFCNLTPFYLKEKDGWHIANPEWTSDLGPFKTREAAREYARRHGLMGNERKKRGK